MSKNLPSAYWKPSDFKKAAVWLYSCRGGCLADVVGGDVGHVLSGCRSYSWANERSRSNLSDEAQLHRAWQIINRDLFHLRPRTFADGLGSKEPAYITNPDQFGVRLVAGVDP